MIRVLVAEDSAAVSALLVSILSDDPDIEVVGEARTGTEAVRLTERLRPDAVTMDIHMPELDGLQATEAIMTHTPTPIIIVSSVVHEKDVEMSLQATRAGALTAMPKPGRPGTPAFQDDAAQLVTMVKAMSQVKVVRRRASASALTAPTIATLPPVVPLTLTARQEPIHVVAIAASTGGPAALQQLLSTLPHDFPTPILVVQHIAKGFIHALVRWLAGSCTLSVKVAEHGERLTPSTVYIAPDNQHLGVSPQCAVALSSAAHVGGFRPAGTWLFQSVANTYGSKAAGVILTGMGRDGVDGLKTLHATGGWVIAQDEASSVIYGMPQEAVRAGVVDEVVGLTDMGRTIVGLPLASGQLSS